MRQPLCQSHYQSDRKQRPGAQPLLPVSQIASTQASKHTAQGSTAAKQARTGKPPGTTTALLECLRLQLRRSPVPLPLKPNSRSASRPTRGAAHAAMAPAFHGRQGMRGGVGKAQTGMQARVECAGRACNQPWGKGTSHIKEQQHQQGATSPGQPRGTQTQCTWSSTPPP
jgi:hypothetical protein